MVGANIFCLRRYNYLRYIAAPFVVVAIICSNDLVGSTKKTQTSSAFSSTSEIGEEGDTWSRIRDFMRSHECTSAYIDVGSNIGVQIRKLYEPQKYNGFDPKMKDLAERFGLLEEPTEGELELGLVKGQAFWNTTSAVLPIFDEYFGAAPRCGVCAIGVEPNPKHTSRLNDLQASLRAAGAPVLWLHQTAADIADGFTTLNVNAGGGMDINDVGMTVKAVAGGTFSRPKEGNEVVVATIDLSRLIWTVRGELKGNIADGEAKVVMKLDIEGAEYRVVPHLLNRDALCAVDLVFLEWHETDIRAEERKSLVTRIAGALERCDTVVSPIDDETFLHDGKDFPTASVC